MYEYVKRLGVEKEDGKSGGWVASCFLGGGGGEGDYFLRIGFGKEEARIG